MPPAHTDDLQAALLQDPADVAVPPAAEVVGAGGCQVIQDAVQPLVVRAAVLEEEDAAGRFGGRGHLLQLRDGGGRAAQRHCG